MLKINFEFDGVAYSEQPMHLVDVLADKDLSDFDREMINKDLTQIALEQAEFLGDLGRFSLELDRQGASYE
jgi:hypothetical protein